jgi:3',5'-nucleoside bisphosphate phosphatase
MSIVLDRPLASERTVVDLHLHSTISDGDDNPAELAGKCVEAGLKVVACTDHDSTTGYDAFRAAAEPAGLTVVPGTEITARWHNHQVHCLAYFFDPGDAGFRTRLEQVHRAAVDWWRAWFDRAEQIGVPVSWSLVAGKFGADRVAYLGDYLDTFLAAAGDDPRFAGYERGGTHERFIAQWCQPGQALHVPRPWQPDLAEVVGWVRSAGGAAVLAHPGRLPGEPLAELAEIGLAGFEAWTTWHDEADTVRVVAACERFGLVATQGSDFHGGRLKPWSPAPGLVPSAASDPLRTVEALWAGRDR